MIKHMEEMNTTTGRNYTVWCGGAEVNDQYLTLEEAKELEEQFSKEGYDDVVIEFVGERKTRTLRVVCFADKDAYEKIREVEEGHKRATYFGGVYLHGKLEAIKGFDCVGILNPFDFDRYIVRDRDTGERLDDCPAFTGVYPCKVEGVEEPCIAFLWRNDQCNVNYDGHYVDILPRMQGLIVLASDTMALTQAANSFNINEEDI